jgi:simple sugar transport system ATP-binding protein
MQGIVKRFGETIALSGVDFEVCTREIHALLGENGAGKSTLMHVLSGLTRPDSGTIRLGGNPVRLSSPQVARKHGIAMVHQHFALVPAFTVAENLALDAEPQVGKRFSAQRAAESALAHAQKLGWKLEPNALVSSLPVGVQQRIEIVKALATEANLLIFDEPTAVLSPLEVEELFAVLRQLRDEGKGVILIAHKLAEIMAVADRVTVLRRGERVARASIAETDTRQLAEWMVGAKPPANLSVTRETTALNLEQSKPLFVAEGLEALGERGEVAVSQLSMEVHAGEIFGIGGVDGNGQAELAEVLVGLRPPKAGTLLWQGVPFADSLPTPLGYIPQDRRRVGLATTMTVEDNLLLFAVQEPAFRKAGLLQRKSLRALSKQLIETFDIRVPSATIAASALSGGNQQKIVVARALRNSPLWIVAMNPTRGLDVGATRFVHDQLRKAKARGAAIVLITTDLDELQLLSDRAAILSRGHLTPIALTESSASDIGLLLGGMESAERVEA